MQHYSGDDDDGDYIHSDEDRIDDGGREWGRERERERERERGAERRKPKSGKTRASITTAGVSLEKVLGDLEHPEKREKRRQQAILREKAALREAARKQENVAFWRKLAVGALVAAVGFFSFKMIILPFVKSLLGGGPTPPASLLNFGASDPLSVLEPIPSPRPSPSPQPAANPIKKNNQ